MSEYTVEDVDKVVLDLYDGRAEYGELESAWWSLFYDLDGKGDSKESDLGTLTLVTQEGGEGEGYNYFVVIKITGPDGTERLFKRLGYHVSHDGSYLDGPTVEVKPVERVVTFYE